MHIVYVLSSYISHQLSGKNYVECLQHLGHNVEAIINPATDSNNVLTLCHTDIFSHADLIILHDEPLNISPLFAAFPLLEKKRVIAYAVWETPTLPKEYKHSLALCSEVWTCSQFSASAIKKELPHVHVLPHVVKRTVPTKEDIDWAKKKMHAADGSFIFFSIIDASNPRKNINALLSAFSAVKTKATKPIRLVLKQYRLYVDYSSLPDVVSINEDLSLGRMAALHIVSHAYISTHHSEAWGLGLSEAMSYSKPAIATAYSGNLEFMNEENSFLIPYTLTHVSSVMNERIPHFSTNMHWADIDIKQLEVAMNSIVAKKYDPEVLSKASEITKDFGPEKIEAILRSLL